MRTNVPCSLAQLQRAPRALAVLVTLVFCAQYSLGCADCRGAAETPSAETPTHSRSAAEITSALARALPSDTHAVVMVRSWRSALQRYEDARPQLEADRLRGARERDQGSRLRNAAGCAGGGRNGLDGLG